MAEATQTDEERKSFTSAKMDLINCLLIDRRLTSTQFRVAVCLLQHENRQTGALYPSQERIGALLNTSTRHVRTCIKALIDTGWLRRRRKNRQLSNNYKFDHANVNVMLDYRASMDETLRAQRAKTNADRHSPSSQKALTGNIPPLETGSIDPHETG